MQSPKLEQLVADLEAVEHEYASLAKATVADTERLSGDRHWPLREAINAIPAKSLNDLRAKARAKIGALAQAVLDARLAHPGATLADLYDPDVMPADLRKAHHALDAAVDKLYRTTPFGSDRERVEHLFGLYEKLVAPLSAAASTPKRASRARAPA